MQRIARPRRYVSPAQLYAMLPMLRYSDMRDAYILRFVGETHGPVLRMDRRRGQRDYTGPERRQSRPAPRASRAPLVDPVATSRPSGGVRVLGPAEAAARRSDTTRRRRRHGRQRPPRRRH